MLRYGSLAVLLSIMSTLLRPLSIMLIPLWVVERCLSLSPLKMLRRGSSGQRICLPATAIILVHKTPRFTLSMQIRPTALRYLMPYRLTPRQLQILQAILLMLVKVTIQGHTHQCHHTHPQHHSPQQHHIHRQRLIQQATTNNMAPIPNPHMELEHMGQAHTGPGGLLTSRKNNTMHRPTKTTRDRYC